MRINNKNTKIFITCEKEYLQKLEIFLQYCDRDDFDHSKIPSYKINVYDEYSDIIADKTRRLLNIEIDININYSIIDNYNFHQSFLKEDYILKFYAVSLYHSWESYTRVSHFQRFFQGEFIKPEFITNRYFFHNIENFYETTNYIIFLREDLIPLEESGFYYFFDIDSTTSVETLIRNINQWETDYYSLIDVVQALNFFWIHKNELELKISTKKLSDIRINSYI